MKLNPDCVRDILLTVEEGCDIGRGVSIPGPNHSRLQSYNESEVLYHIRQCDLSGFLYQAKTDLLGMYTIRDLTPAGHEFLANIRKDTIWSGVKDVAGKVGATSLNAIVQIASNVVAQIIKHQFGLT